MVIYRRHSVPLKVPKTQSNETVFLLALRDRARALIEAEADSLDDSDELEKKRAALNRIWGAYVAEYGPINRTNTRNSGRTDDEGNPIISRVMPPAVRRVVRNDPYGPLIAALESFDPETQTAKPAGLLRERQIVPRQPILGTDDPHEALTLCIDSVGKVDLEVIGKLLDVSPDQARQQLGNQIFELPQDPGSWVSRTEYLSGDVRQKLEDAVRADVENAGDERFKANVDELRKVIPADIGPGDIDARIGSTWISAADYTQFMHDVFQDPNGSVRHYGGSNWEVSGSRWGVQVRQVWGTDDLVASEIFENLLKQKENIVKVTDPVTKIQSFDAVATQAVQDKAEAMQEKFSEWLWSDPDRTTRLVNEYNRRFNSQVLRSYDGKYLTLPGLAKNFVPRAHQLAAVDRILNEGSVGLFHQVGAGKTATMVMAANELKRLGMVNKPAVVVPNHMLEQFSREWVQLYPQAKLLAASSKDLSGDKRRQFVARAATNDWDAVVMTRTAFERLKLQPENEQAYLERNVELVRTQLETARQKGESNQTLKDMQKNLSKVEEKMKALLDKPQDPGISFEQTGIDYLFVDEMHDFKNLGTVSSIQEASKKGSKRATDMHMKIEWLRSVHGERVLTSATATPIANSISEMHIMCRYHDPKALERAGLSDFDSWAATFAQVTTNMEVNIVGDTFKPKRRFARFTNVPELTAMFRKFGDVLTAEDLDLPVPKVKARQDTGERTMNPISVDATPALESYIQRLSDRVTRIEQRGVDPHEDNMLKVSNDGRMAALDMRLVTDESKWDLLDTPTTKIEVAADKLASVWAENRNNIYVDPATGEESDTPGSLQIVFCDRSTPKKDGTWNVYESLRDELYARGLPAGSVRFMQDAKNDEQKAALFKDCREGRVSVIIGSTETMGVGTNIQTRAVHMLHMDPPWRPADIEQRNGRIIRQGNQNAEVEMSVMITEGSFDTYMWQTLQRKATFINQIMNAKTDGRQVEDIGGDSLSFTEFKAIASGNPLLLKEAEAKTELQKWSRRKKSHDQNQRALKQTIEQKTKEIENLTRRLPLAEKVADRSVDTSGDKFRIEIGEDFRVPGQPYVFTERSKAAEFFNTHRDLGGRLRLDARAGIRGDLGVLATVGGQPISVRYDSATVYFEVDDMPQIRRTLARNDWFNTTSAGFITRMENLAKTAPQQPASINNLLQDAQQRLSDAKSFYGQEFPYTEELKEAQNKYQQICELLAADEDSQQPQHQETLTTATYKDTEEMRQRKPLNRKEKETWEATAAKYANQDVDWQQIAQYCPVKDDGPTYNHQYDYDYHQPTTPQYRDERTR